MDFKSLKTLVDFENLLKKTFGSQVHYYAEDSSFEGEPNEMIGEVCVYFADLIPSKHIGLVFRLRECKDYEDVDMLDDGVLSWVVQMNGREEEQIFCSIKEFEGYFPKEYDDLTPIQKEVMDNFLDLSDGNNGIKTFFKAAQNCWKDGTKVTITMNGTSVCVHSSTLKLIANSPVFDFEYPVPDTDKSYSVREELCRLKTVLNVAN